MGGAPPLENNSKFLTILTVAQIAFFLKILVEVKIIDHQIQAEVIRFIARHFKTKKTDTIAVESLRTKYHNVESSTIEAVGKIIAKMLKFTKD